MASHQPATAAKHTRAQRLNNACHHPMSTTQPIQNAMDASLLCSIFNCVLCGMPQPPPLWWHTSISAAPIQAGTADQNKHAYQSAGMVHRLMASQQTCQHRKTFTTAGSACRQDIPPLHVNLTSAQLDTQGQNPCPDTNRPCTPLTLHTAQLSTAEQRWLSLAFHLLQLHMPHNQPFVLPVAALQHLADTAVADVSEGTPFGARQCPRV